jgi:hypothetical protein
MSPRKGRERKFPSDRVQADEVGLAARASDFNPPSGTLLFSGQEIQP